MFGARRVARRTSRRTARRVSRRRYGPAGARHGRLAAQEQHLPVRSMSASDLAIVTALVFAWGMLSARLERFDVTAPILFVLAGVLLTHGPLATLGFVPSTGRSSHWRSSRWSWCCSLMPPGSGCGTCDSDMGLCLRLLGIGLPLTIGLGTLLAFALFNGMGIWLALLVGAALAPTDAALGAGIMVNPAVPARIRRLINVESGLNDGIATPVVLVALAGAGTAGHAASIGPAEASVSWRWACSSAWWWAGRADSWCGPRGAGAGPRGLSPARRCWRWRYARTPARWRCTVMALLPPSWAGSPSAPSAASAASG